MPVTAAAGRSGVCGGSIPVHGGVALDMTALDGLVRRRRDVPHRGRAGRHLRAGPRGRARRGRRRLHPRALAPVDGPLDRRRLAGLPRGGAVLDPLREDRGHGHRPRGRAGRRSHRAHRGARAPRRHRAEPDPALRGQRGHPRRHHRGPAPPPPAARRPGAPRLRLLHASPTVSMRAAGSSAGGRRRPSCASTTRRSRTATSTSPTPTSSSSSTRPTSTSCRAPWRSSTRSAAPSPGRSRSTVTWSSAGSGTATTSPRSHRSGAAASSSTRPRSRGRGRRCPALFDEVIAALTAIEGTLAASAHQSHAYTDGACLYFTFGGRGPEGDAEWRERYYRQAWDAVTDATMAHGAAISHHHGIGLNRSRFLPRALGSGFEVLAGPQGDVRPRRAS